MASSERFTDMPDRTDPPQTPPPVVVAVNPANPEASYVGANRRADNSSRADVNVNLPPPADATFLWGIPEKAQGWVKMGAVGLLMSFAVMWALDDRSARRRLEEREVARYAEVVELQRARESQYDRQHAATVSELRALIAKFDAAMERMAGATAAVDRTRAELTDALNRVFAELKRLVPARPPKKAEAEPNPTSGFVNPILWLTDHAPPTAMPGGAR